MAGQDRPYRVVVAITGATGAAFGVAILQRLMDIGAEVHLVLTRWGLRNSEHQLGTA